MVLDSPDVHITTKDLKSEQWEINGKSMAFFLFSERVKAERYDVVNISMKST